MKHLVRLLIIIAALAGLSASAHANQNAQGWCEDGGQTVTTSGLVSTTLVQTSYPGCTITVFIHGGGLALIYSDNNGTPLANPFTANTNSQWLFYAAAGRYDIQMSGAGLPTPITYSDVLLFDSQVQNVALLPNTNLVFSPTPAFNATTNIAYTMNLTSNVTSSTITGTPANGNVLALNLCQTGSGGFTFAFPSNFIIPSTFSFITSPAPSCNYLAFKFDGTSWTFLSQPGGAGGGGTFYQIVQVAGAGLPQEPKLNFAAYFNCVDNPGNTSTDCTPKIFPGAGGSHSPGIVPDAGPTVQNFPLCDNGTFSAICQGPSGVTPAGPNGCVQTAAGGDTSLACTANLFDIGNVFIVKDYPQFFGPVPYVDATAYGVRSMQFNIAPAVPGITATCSALSSNCTLSSASTFQNGDGVTIYGLGPNHSMPTPTAMTALNANAAASTGSGYDVTAPAGVTTGICYKGAWRDRGQGITAAGPEVCITNGNPLGAQTVAITNCTISGTTHTCTTAANTVAAGAVVQITGTSVPQDCDGWETLTSATSTQIVWNDGRNTNSGTGTSCTGGSLIWYNSNELIVPPPTGAEIEYAIYRGATNAETLYDVMSESQLFLTGDPSNLVWDDYGSPMMNGIASNLQFFWPTNFPTSPVPDSLTTTICAGAGTTSITLCGTSTNAVTSAPILFDDGPTLLAANAAANSIGGYVLLPPGTNPFIINSFTTFVGNLSISRSLVVNDTLDFQGKLLGTLQPSFKNSSLPQFGLGWNSGIGVYHANPGVIIEASSNVRDIGFGSQTTGNGFKLVELGSSIPSVTIDNATFGTAGSGDYMSIGLIQAAQFAAGGASGDDFQHILGTFGPGQGNGNGTTPGFMFKNMGELNFRCVMLNHRGFLFVPNQAGMNVDYNQCYEEQGPITPQITTYTPTCCNVTSLHLSNTVMDTGSSPTVAALGANHPIVRVDNSIVIGNPTLYTGIAAATLTLNGFQIQAASIGQNFNVVANISTFIADGLVATGTSNFAQGATLQSQSMPVGAQSAIYTATSAPAAPTCSVSAGGTVAIGTYTFVYTPSFLPNNGLGVPSVASTSCTTSSGNQTISITPPTVLGSVGSGAFYATSGPATGILSCTIPAPLTGGAYVWSSPASGPCSSTLPFATPGGGPAGIFGMNLHSYTNTITGYQDFQQQPASPSWGNPPVGFCRWYYSNAGLLAGVNNAGTACGPSGGAGNIANAPQFSVGIYTGSGSTNQIGGVPAPTGINSVPQLFISTPAGGAATQGIFAPQGFPGRTNTIATDTIVGTDRVNRVTETFAGAVAIGIADPGTTGFAGNYVMKLKVQGAGAVDTLTSTTQTCNGAATCVFNQGQDAVISSPNNTNWVADIHDPPLIAGTNITLTRGDFGLTINSTAGGGSVTHTAGALTLGQLVCGNAGADIAVCNLSGDATTSGSTAVTVSKINGTSFTGTNGDVVSFGASNTPADSGVVAANLVTQTSNAAANQICAYTGANKVCVPTTTLPTAAVPAFTGDMTNSAGSLATTVSKINGGTWSVTNGDLVSSTANQPTDSGVVAANVVTAAANAGATNDIWMSGGANKTAVAKSPVDVSQYRYIAGAGSVNVMTAAFSPAASSLVTGLEVDVLPNLANTTTTPTLNINSLGAATITKCGTTALVAGDYTTSSIAKFVYDGTRWQLINPQAVPCASAIGTVVCAPGALAAQTDAATVTWAIGGNVCSNASLTFTVHSGSRTLNLTGLVSGGYYAIKLIQDATGGESLTGGTGCTWKQKGGGGGTFTLTGTANAVDFLVFQYDGTNCNANLGLGYN